MPHPVVAVFNNLSILENSDDPAGYFYIKIITSIQRSMHIYIYISLI